MFLHSNDLVSLDINSNLLRVSSPAKNKMFKVTDLTNKLRCEIFPKLSRKETEQSLSTFSVVLIANFSQISHLAPDSIDTFENEFVC